MPKLSVIMPARNAEAFLRPAVNSTLRAMPRDSELLVCNDGSSDGTSRILRSIHDDRLRIFDNGHTSKGVATTLNTLIQHATGAHIARMDADDYCLPWRFVLQEHQLSKNCQITFSTAIQIDARGRPIGVTSVRPINPTAAPHRLLQSNPFVHSTMYADAIIFKSGLAYRDIGAEDYDLWLRLTAQGYKIRRSAIPTLLYRQHADQITRTRTDGKSINDVWLHNTRLQESLRELSKIVQQAC